MRIFCLLLVAFLFFVPVRLYANDYHMESARWLLALTGGLFCGHVFTKTSKQ